MALEHWTRWEPIKGLSGQYCIKSVEANFDGFTIILTNLSDKRIIVKVFYSVGTPEAYQNTNKKYRIATLNNLQKHYGEDFYANWTFFKVENSSYIQWARNEACGTAEYRPFIHFAFITQDSILDVLDVYEPEVTFINLPEQTT